MYAAEAANGPIVVTDQRKPAAVLVPIENANLETVALSTNAKFIDLIERSRTRVRAKAGIPTEEMCERFH
jgi:hypothetical protein